MATIYRKTDKGRAEIETRAHRLMPRLRQALIMVDGNRRDDDLAKLILQDPAETLTALLRDGFIEVARVTEATARAAIAGAPALQTAAGAAGTDQPAVVPFIVRRREAVRALMDAVGPFGEPVAMRLEKAADDAALQPILALARQVIRTNRGNEAAEAFGKRFISDA